MAEYLVFVICIDGPLKYLNRTTLGLVLQSLDDHGHASGRKRSDLSEKVGR